MLITKRQQFAFYFRQRLARFILLLQPASRFRMLIPKTSISVQQLSQLFRIVAHNSFVRRKLKEFASSTENLEETFENREQIEISRYYERLPKPTLIAADEFLRGNVYFRNPLKERDQQLNED